MVASGPRDGEDAAQSASERCDRICSVQILYRAGAAVAHPPFSWLTVAGPRTRQSQGSAAERAPRPGLQAAQGRLPRGGQR